MIKYVGMKYLNSGLYKKILLKKENNFVKVRAVADQKTKKISTIKLDVTSITEQVKELDDYHKIEEIILYFLRNNTICEISQGNDDIVVVSTSERELILKLSKEYTPLLSYIIDKYNKDRLDYIDNCSQNRIHIRTSHLNEKNKIISQTSNYFEGHEKDKEDESILVLTLARTKGDIARFDKVFIIEYIKELLERTEERIIYFDNVVWNPKYGLKVWIDDKEIEIPGEIEREVKLLIRNRNVEIERINQKQYKLEGII